MKKYYLIIALFLIALLGFGSCNSVSHNAGIVPPYKESVYQGGTANLSSTNVTGTFLVNGAPVGSATVNWTNVTAALGYIPMQGPLNSTNITIALGNNPVAVATAAVSATSANTTPYATVAASATSANTSILATTATTANALSDYTLANFNGDPSTLANHGYTPASPTENFTAGNNLIPSQLVYIKSGGKLDYASASSNNTIPPIALTKAISSNNTMTTVLLPGSTYRETAWNFTAGDRAWLSSTAGNVTNLPPAPSGYYAICVGVFSASDTLVFCWPVWVQVP